MTDDLDNAIAKCEAAGLTVVRPRDSLDDQLRERWDNMIAVLRIARGIAEDGGKLTIEHPAWLNPKADPVKLYRDGIVSKIDEILATAVVRKKEYADAAE